jgi:hypothetical protein
LVREHPHKGELCLCVARPVALASVVCLLADASRAETEAVRVAVLAVEETKAKRQRTTAPVEEDEVKVKVEAKETKARGRGKGKAAAADGASSSSSNGKQEKKADDSSDFKYLTGFGGEHETEALPDALPKGQFMPQKCVSRLFRSIT